MVTGVLKWDDEPISCLLRPGIRARWDTLKLKMGTGFDASEDVTKRGDDQTVAKIESIIQKTGGGPQRPDGSHRSASAPGEA
jgi:hypothetical protein